VIERGSGFAESMFEYLESAEAVRFREMMEGYLASHPEQRQESIGQLSAWFPLSWARVFDWWRYYPPYGPMLNPWTLAVMANPWNPMMSVIGPWSYLMPGLRRERRMASPVYLTASGVVGVAGVPTTILSIFATATATAGTLNLRNGTTVAAPIKASIAVPASTTASPTLGPSGLTFSSGLFAEFASNIASASFGVT
jgi:hypothetical protein